MLPICVSDDGHFLTTADGAPFYWLGDTAWELFHRLNREDAAAYLSARASQGFNVVQAVALSEFEGLSVPNAFGRTPLLRDESGAYDPCLADLDGFSYWHFMDEVIGMAEARGLYVALLPSWGDKWNRMWGKGPEIFTPKNAFCYGRWIGGRYAGRANVVWMMGGDRRLASAEHRLIVRAMAEGIRAAGAAQLMTFHPGGGHSSSEDVQEEGWLQMNAIQSGHGARCLDSWKLIAADRGLSPVRPVINAEPRYEDHPAYFRSSAGYLWGAWETRVHAWWDPLSGAAGVTYGNHSVWSMTTEVTPYFPFTWREALWHEGAQQARIPKDVCLRWAPVREPCPELIADPGDATGHIAACRCGENALVYSPLGLPFRANLQLLSPRVEQPVRARWIDPRSGKQSVIGLFPGEPCTFVPPAQGQGNDWALVLETLRER